jgi:rubrerythrin
LRAYDLNDLLARKKMRNKTFSQATVRTRRSKAVDTQSQQQQNVVLDNTLDDNMEKVIVNIMGVDDRFKIRNFVQRMHAQDAATIREWLRENTPGIDTMVDITCPECGHEFAVELPITESFFRPKKK